MTANVVYKGDVVSLTWDSPVDLTDSTGVSLFSRALGSDTRSPVAGAAKKAGTNGEVTAPTTGNEVVGQYDIELVATWAAGVTATFGGGTLTVLPTLNG